MGHNEKTGKKAGKAASDVLRGKQYSKKAKSAAGSALTQRRGHGKKGGGKKKK